ERSEVVVVLDVCAAGASVSPEIGRDHVISGGGDRDHHSSPAVCELWISVNQQHCGPITGFEACFEHMHPDAVAVVDETRADAGGEKRRVGLPPSCCALPS